jgi:hypothetical protein
MLTSTPSIGAITPFKAFWHWLLAVPPVKPPRAGRAACQPAGQNFRHTDTLRNQMLSSTPCTASHASERRPLRMVRVMEVGQTPAQVGRMVISGRMADVCAELDRLAACETRLH